MENHVVGKCNFLSYTHKYLIHLIFYKLYICFFLKLESETRNYYYTLHILWTCMLIIFIYWHRFNKFAIHPYSGGCVGLGKLLGILYYAISRNILFPFKFPCLADKPFFGNSTNHIPFYSDQYRIRIPVELD